MSGAHGRGFTSTGLRLRVFHVEHFQEEGAPLVSIFIRARNESEHIGQCLDMVFSQDVNFEFEVVVLDCESTDGTAEIARGYPLRLYSIPPRLFTYSGALNLGLDICRGKYFAPLSAHAVPASRDWLRFHVEHLEGSSEVAATYSRQVPWGGESVPEVRAIEKSFPKPTMGYGIHEVRTLVSAGAEAFTALPFSNASSCVRTELAREVGFREVPFSEDRAFALDMLASSKGLAEIGYVGQAEVRHSHAPRFFTFYQEARKATISRGLINGLYKKLIDSDYDAGIRESRGALYLKLLPLAALVTVQVLICVPRGTYLEIRGRREEAARVRRQISFYLSSFGTTLGKIRGIWEYQSVKDYACPAAPMEKLKESLTQLK